MVVACMICTLLLTASTNLYYFPLIFLISKSYFLKNSNHLVFLAFNVGCSKKYFRPLWSALNSNFFPNASTFQCIYYGNKLQIMCGIIPFMFFKIYKLITNDISILSKDSTESFFECIHAYHKIFIWICNIQNRCISK